MNIRSICVFCGSSAGCAPEYRFAAQELGRLLVEREVRLVFGGGDVGLMGAVSQAVMAGGGEAVGVIPKRIREMVGIIDLTELKVVEDMHARKAVMHELSDAYVILPGGIGTFEEFFETFTWYQLGYHSKPIGLLNVNGYFDRLIALLEHVVSQGFLKQDHLTTLIIDRDPVLLLDRLDDHQGVYIPKL